MLYQIQIIFLTIHLYVQSGASRDLTNLGIKTTMHHLKRGTMVRETRISADKQVYFALNLTPYYGRHFTVLTKNWNRFDAMLILCRLATLRIVEGFVVCQINSNDKPVIAKVNIRSRATVKRTLHTSKTKSNPKDVDIMVDENGIWILYQGDNNGILEKISMKDLSTIKRISVDSINTDHHAIVVSNKFYIMTSTNGSLTIIKAIDTENTKNIMSYKVILSNDFPEHCRMHYNPKLKQLFVAVTEKKTYIYKVEHCKFSYPNSNSIDLSKINSTFVWSLLPSDNAHYLHLIHSLSTFFDINNYHTLNQLSDILISCPYHKCLMPGMANDVLCRLNTIRLLFETFVKHKVNSLAFNQLQVQLDMLKLLEQSQFRTLTYALNQLKQLLNKGMIDEKKHIHNFRSKLGLYFNSLAEFNSRKYQSDIELVHSIFAEFNKKQQSIAPLLTSKLSTLFNQALESNSAEMAGTTSNVAIASTAFVNPFTIFDSSDAILEMQDRLAKLTKTFVNVVKLKVIAKYIRQLKEIGKNLQPKIEAMTEKFPSIREIVRKAMAEHLTEEDIKNHTNGFLKEYSSYRPAFQISTINEYESVLSEIINKLCEIIYSGNSLAGAVAQGVLASKGTCLATKLDVQNLMGIYRDMYDKQDALFHALVSAVRTTIAKHNAKRIVDVSGRITRGQFENSIIDYKMATLEVVVNSEVNILFIIHDACILLEYKNGGVMLDYCKSAIEDPQSVLNNNIVISSMFDEDMCNRDNVEKYVYIPAQRQSLNSKIPQGTIDLTSLYNGYETVFQIPSKEWLVENNWIYEDEKDKMIVLQKFELFIPNNSSSPIDVKTSTRYLSHNVIRPGGRVYSFSVDTIYQYNFRYRQGGALCTLLRTLPTAPYQLHSCPKLPSICVLSEGKTENPAAYPSVYSKFGIKLLFVGNIHEPIPKTNFFLIASVKLCIVEPMIPQGKQKKQNTKLNSKPHSLENPNWKSSSCCGKSHQYYDRLVSQKCQPCPNGSTPRLGGYYCE